MDDTQRLAEQWLSEHEPEWLVQSYVHLDATLREESSFSKNIRGALDDHLLALTSAERQHGRWTVLGHAEDGSTVPDTVSVASQAASSQGHAASGQVQATANCPREDGSEVPDTQPASSQGHAASGQVQATATYLRQDGSEVPDAQPASGQGHAASGQVQATAIYLRQDGSEVLDTQPASGQGHAASGQVQAAANCPREGTSAVPDERPASSRGHAASGPVQAIANTPANPKAPAKARSKAAPRVPCRLCDTQLTLRSNNDSCHRCLSQKARCGSTCQNCRDRNPRDESQWVCLECVDEIAIEMAHANVLHMEDRLYYRRRLKELQCTQCAAARHQAFLRQNEMHQQFQADRSRVQEMRREEERREENAAYQDWCRQQESQ